MIRCHWSHVVHECLFRVHIPAWTSKSFWLFSSTWTGLDCLGIRWFWALVQFFSSSTLLSFLNSLGLFWEIPVCTCKWFSIVRLMLVWLFREIPVCTTTSCEWFKRFPIIWLMSVWGYFGKFLSALTFRSKSAPLKCWSKVKLCRRSRPSKDQIFNIQANLGFLAQELTFKGVENYFTLLLKWHFY